MDFQKQQYDAGQYMNFQYYNIVAQSLALLQQYHRDGNAKEMYYELVNLSALLPFQITTKKDKENQTDIISAELQNASDLLKTNQQAALIKMFDIRRRIISILYENNMLFSTWKKKQYTGNLLG